jgi:LytS/YehU family sensor histidine kinase
MMQFSRNALAYVAGGVLLGLLPNRHRSDRRVSAAQLEARLAQLQLENLRAQLCPHFLFNALNAASALVTSDPEGAERMISQISELLRVAIRTEGVQEVPFAYELWFADRYLAVERVRFGERLAVSYDIDDDARDALVPNFLLQPIVENAVHHGISPQAGQGRLEIAAKRHKGDLRITVRDNGKGLSEGFAKRVGGIGLAHTRRRLEYLCGPDGFTFELHPLLEGGVCAEVCVPFYTSAASS